MSEDEFVDAVTEGQSLSPLYFAFAANRNKQVHDLLHEGEPPRRWRSPRCSPNSDVVRWCSTPEIPRRSRRVISSARTTSGSPGRYAEYTGDVLTADQPIVLVCDAGTELEAKNRLARIGFDKVVGWLYDPMSSFLDHPGWIVAASRLTVRELDDVDAPCRWIADRRRARAW